MTLHALKEYLLYSFKAKTRHGVHSPFVYEFIERVLRTPNLAKESSEVLQIIGNTNNKYSLDNLLPIRYQHLIYNLAVFNGYTKLGIIETSIEDKLITNDFFLVLGEPMLWLDLLHKYLPALSSSSCVLIANIHKTKSHSENWALVCKHHEIKVSIDLYGIGVLFFNEDFREKQHFVLRY